MRHPCNYFLVPTLGRQQENTSRSEGKREQNGEGDGATRDFCPGAAQDLVAALGRAQEYSCRVAAVGLAAAVLAMDAALFLLGILWKSYGLFLAL